MFLGPVGTFVVWLDTRPSKTLESGMVQSVA
jgi:hypothetical protein